MMQYLFINVTMSIPEQLDLPSPKKEKNATENEWENVSNTYSQPIALKSHMETSLVRFEY